MDVAKAIELVTGLVVEIFVEAKIDQPVTSDMPLIGGESSLDSMNLVELCLRLEDHASDLDFEFDWTSDDAMSKSRGMFRSVRSLSEELLAQHEAQQ